MKDIKTKDNFIPLVSTTDFVCFEIIKNKINSLVKDKSNIKVGHDNNWEFLTLEIKDNLYDNILPELLYHLKTNDRVNNVYWYDKNGQMIPCNYYPLAYGVGGKMEDVRDFRNNFQEYIKKDVFINYDYDTNRYYISVKSDNKEYNINTLIIFTDVYGTKPFDNIFLDSNDNKKLVKQKN